MIVPKEELLFTILLVAIMATVILIIKKAIRRFSFVQAIEINRRKVIFNLCYFVIYIISGFFLALIWGVKFQDFTIFISSVLAVLGVGFFAQWSILSNLTASFILFFYHPIRIGHRIKIIDKDYDWTGEVKNITAFYFFIKTDAGQNISLPNSLVMQKGIEILDKEEAVEKEEKELYKE
jgi:small-conductance mechanosensitive channel